MISLSQRSAAMMKLNSQLDLVSISKTYQGSPQTITSHTSHNHLLFQ